MQLYPDDLWKRDPTRHPSFRIPDRPDVPLWRYLSGKRWTRNGDLYRTPGAAQMTKTNAAGHPQ
jgi:hypothetical protein